MGLVGIRGTNVDRGDGPAEYSSRQQEWPRDRPRNMGRMREKGGTWVGIVICPLTGNGNRVPPNDQVRKQWKISIEYRGTLKAREKRGQAFWRKKDVRQDGEQGGEGREEMLV